MARKLGNNGGGKAAKKKDTSERVADTVTEVVRLNVTPATKAEFLDDCQALHTEMQLAQAKVREVSGRYRARLKDAEKNGVDAKAIAWVIAARKRDPEELAREIRATNEMAVIGKLAIGNVQMMLFEDGSSVGGKVDAAHAARQAPASEEDIEHAGEAGYIAGKAGKPVEDCPYEDPGSLEALKWVGRHRDAQAENLATLGRGPLQSEASH
jgi:ribosome modulation factor